MTTLDRSLTRANIRARLPAASRETLESWRFSLINREADLRHFLPEWPGLADSFAEDIRAIDARLAELQESP